MECNGSMYNQYDKNKIDGLGRNQVRTRSRLMYSIKRSNSEPQQNGQHKDKMMSKELTDSR
jgi:hypothetical protein